MRIVGGESKTVRVRKGSTGADILDRLGLNRETVVMRINGRICSEEEALKGGELIEVIKVVTGG